uniref:Uncharacterized protein n=1 Tax=Rhizophora mucronata TaxID=61149 RepID=A0A2P2P7G8_RHIMU
MESASSAATSTCCQPSSMIRNLGEVPPSDRLLRPSLTPSAVTSV